MAENDDNKKATLDVQGGNLGSPENGDGSSHEHPAPNPENGKVGLTRRVFSRVLAGLGLWELTGQITGGQVKGPSHLLMQMFSRTEHGDEVSDPSAEKELDAKADELIAQAKEKIKEGMSPQEALMFTIDAMGSANFFVGVRDLLPNKIGAVGIPGKPVGHINSSRYAWMAGLSALKYVASDAEGRKHLEHETVASMTALGIIGGTIVAAEGLELDLDRAYEEAKGRSPQDRDKVAIMTMLASLMSPLITTVGSSSLIRKMSNELATTVDTEGEKSVDTDLAAVSVSHVSNLSGYLMFGDPPFIAVCEKYGFAEGVAWQAKTMWPLALYSLVSSTAKLNYILAKREGLKGKAAWAKAIQDSVAGITENIKPLAKIMGKSLLNFAKYWPEAVFPEKFKQDKSGIETKIGEVLLEKLAGAKNLLLNDAPPEHEHAESHEGLVRENDPQGTAVDRVMSNVLTKSSDAAADSLRDLLVNIGNRSNVTEVVGENVEVFQPGVAERFRAAIEEKDFDEVVAIGREMGIPNIEIIVNQWRDFDDNKKLDQSAPATGEDGAKFVGRTLWQQLNPEAVFDRATDIDRIKGYTGHNLGDVANVFPFQAGSVPFLTPMFKTAVDSMEGMDETVKEAAIFMAIMLFSMMADNYVACKIGLELLPNKPQIALIASIQGGSMTAIGNMANVAQFNLDDYPLAKSLAKMYWHLDDVAVGFAWAKAIDILKIAPPKVKNQEAHASTPKNTGPREVRTASRRDFFRTLGGRGGESQGA